MKKKLITLSSPIAVRNGQGVTRLVNVLEVTSTQQLNAGEILLSIARYFNSTTQLMEDTQTVQVKVKRSNIRCEQEVA